MKFWDGSQINTLQTSLSLNEFHSGICYNKIDLNDTDTKKEPILQYH